MSRAFYIHMGSVRQGPYDMVEIMRKLRGGSISGATLISADHHTDTLPLKDWPELSELLANNVSIPYAAPRKQNATQFFLRGVGTGYRFMSAHPLSIAISGVLVIAAYLAALIAAHVFGPLGSAAVGLFFWFVLQPLGLILLLRLYRGQYLDAHFIRQQLTPMFSTFFPGMLLFGFACLGGMALLFIPCVLVLTVGAFIPFLWLDKRANLARSTRESFRAVTRDGEVFGALFGLMTLQSVSALLVVTLPLSLPILAAALAELYEERLH